MPEELNAAEGQNENKAEKRMGGRVYFVQAEADSTCLVAMDVRINLGMKTISWIDTVKERMFEYESIQNTDLNDFTVRTKDDKGIHFMPMTLKTYNESVKDKLVHGQDFETEEDMLKAFEETKNYIW